MQNNLATNTTLNSLADGRHNVTIVGKNLDGGVGQSGYTYFNITNTTLPDVNKFTIKDSTGNNIAWFGDAGNIVIKGVLEQNSNFIATDNFAFKIRNNLNDVLIIENNGSMYIDGTLQENQATILINMDKNEFRFKWDGEFKTNINESGYIFTKGTLTQN